MEKFGIFELLDALSALTAPGAREQEEKQPDPAPQPAPAPAPAPNANRDALDAFLRRHEDIRRRTDGR